MKPSPTGSATLDRIVIDSYQKITKAGTYISNHGTLIQVSENQLGEDGPKTVIKSRLLGTEFTRVSEDSEISTQEASELAREANLPVLFDLD